MAVLAGCGQQPLKPAATHLREQAAAWPGTIPPPVQVTPLLPQPKPSARPETYSVVVNNVRVQELLFALARDARLNVDIHPDITGTVTLNAIDQTLPQLLTRIARQVDMRYEIDGAEPGGDARHAVPARLPRRLREHGARRAQRRHRVDPGHRRPGQPGDAAAQNNSTATINSVSANKFWDTLVANVKEILQETDKVLPAGAAHRRRRPPRAGAARRRARAARRQPGAPPPVPGATFREAASVIANPETGILNIRATSRQHEKVQEFLDQVMANARRQVLIEATVAEVQLNNQYQRGIDWQRLRSGATATGVPSFDQGASGMEFGQSSAGTPAGINTNAFVVRRRDHQPQLQLRAQAARVVRRRARALEPEDQRAQQPDRGAEGGRQPGVLHHPGADHARTQTSALTTFTTTLNSVPVGFIMSVVPQISETDTVVLNLRPTISRKIGDVADPNPSLAAAGVASLIPVIQTREMESVLRVQSGQIAVLGGLMQDAVTNIEDTIPGVRDLPGIGQIFSQRRDGNQKTELVIFLRPVVIRDASLDGDFAGFRQLLPGADFFRKPNPSRPRSAATVD